MHTGKLQSLLGKREDDPARPMFESDDVQSLHAPIDYYLSLNTKSEI